MKELWKDRRTFPRYTLRNSNKHSRLHFPRCLSQLAVCHPTFGGRAGLPTEARVSGRRLVGLSRFELLTPRLSSVCSNQLSYRPDFAKASSGEPWLPF